MTHARRIGIAVLALTCAFPAAAQNWPARHITMIVPFGPGSGSDIVGRILSQRMSEELGQQVIVENMGGGGGSIGANRAAKSEPDGYTIVMGAVDTFAQNQTLYKNPPYNPVTDFVPILLAGEQPLLLITRKDLPPNSLEELAAYMKINQGKMQFGSSGIGSAPHLACSQLAAAAGVSLAHVPYRGSAPALQDMVAGNLDLYCPLAAGAIPLIEAKSVKALAVLTQQRSPLLPDLPTAGEQGFGNVDGYYWIGFFAPKGTPEPVVAKLTASVEKAIDTPAVQARLRDVGTTVMPPERRSPAYLKTYVEAEIAKWAGIIKASGVAPN